MADWTPGTSYRSDSRFYRASLRSVYDISDALSLTAITSFAHMDFYQRVDADGTSLRIADFINNGDIDSFYQELRLQGEGGPLTWLVGVNYSSDDVKQLANPNFQDWSIPIGSQRVTTNDTVEAVAAFANAEYEIGSGFTVQAGARYTDHEQRMNGCPFDSGDGAAANAFNIFYGFPIFVPGDCLVLNDTDGSFAPVGIVDIPLNEDNISWRAGLSYEPNDDILLYANISRGYKAGSFTLATFQLVSQFQPATQESLLAYEAGFKVTGNTFQFSGAGFYYDYSDKQLLAPFDFGQFGILDKLQNIPESRIVGLELQAVWTPVPELQITLNGTYLDSEVTSSFIATNPLDGSSIDLDGQEFPYTPHWQGLADISYSFPIGDDAEVDLGGTISYRSRSSARFAGGNLYSIRGYALIDLRAGVEFSDGQYAIDVWGRNITNRYYRVNVTTNADTVFAVAGQPATYGVRGTIRF
jgi:outer membrane receptor protein involved in Fe transport